MSYDVEKIRSHFPSLNTGLAFFDGPGGSQVPDVVGAAIAAAITKPISNRNVNTESEKTAEEIVVEFRKAVGDLIDVDPGGVVYGRSWTQLSYDFSRTLAKNWGPGDEIVVSRLDHDSNIRPWIQAAEIESARSVGHRAGPAVVVDVEPQVLHAPFEAVRSAREDHRVIDAGVGCRGDIRQVEAQIEAAFLGTVNLNAGAIAVEQTGQPSGSAQVLTVVTCLDSSGGPRYPNQ